MISIRVYVYREFQFESTSPLLSLFLTLCLFEKKITNRLFNMDTKDFEKLCWFKTMRFFSVMNTDLSLKFQNSK